MELILLYRSSSSLLNVCILFCIVGSAPVRKVVREDCMGTLKEGSIQNTECRSKCS